MAFDPTTPRRRLAGKLCRPLRGRSVLWRKLCVYTFLVGVAGSAFGCADQVPTRTCGVEIWAQPQSGGPVSVIGDWDGWLAPGHALTPSEAYPGWYYTFFELPAGDHRYLLFEDGVGRLDPHNGQTAFWEPAGGPTVEVSWVRVADCSQPAVTVEHSAIADGVLHVDAQFWARPGGAAIDPTSLVVEQRDPNSGVYTEVVDVDVDVDPQLGAIRIDTVAAGAGKQTLRLRATDTAGSPAAAVGVSRWIGARAPTPEDMLIYQVMVDRFRGPGGQPLSPPLDPGARAGGVLDGVTSAIRSGELSELGVTTLWLSPVYLGPEAARTGRDDDHLYEGYHGYWVLDPRAVEPRIGGEQALRELIATAHDQGIGVLLDVVPNHVYEDSSRFVDRPDDSWFNFPESGPCVCGTAACPWHLYIQTCWFTSYLPDFRFQTPGVIEQAVADVEWWDREFDIDGVRIDAVPMMPRAVSRRIAGELRDRRNAGAMPFVLGEVFTGAGQGGIDELRYHLGPDGLDSVFDFPLMWALRGALASEDVTGFVAVEEVLAATEQALEGSGAVLGRMIGNHDVTRFVSEAAGDAGLDPWTTPPMQPVDDTPYLRQRLALAVVLTLPGAPVLYYGDELGLAGGRDPDSRRVMPETLLPIQESLRADVQTLGQLRQCSPALRQGTRQAWVVTPDHYVFARQMDDREVVVALSRLGVSTSIELEPGQLKGGRYVDVLGGDSLPAGSNRIELGAYGMQILLPESDPCVVRQ